MCSYTPWLKGFPNHCQISSFCFQRCDQQTMLSFFCCFNGTKHLIKVEFTLKHINSFSLHFASVLYYNFLSTHCKLDIYHFVCLISVFMQLENKICKEKIKLYILYNGARLNWTFLRQAIVFRIDRSSIYTKISYVGTLFVVCLYRILFYEEFGLNRLHWIN
jgi:hypothetical protein